MYPLLDNVKLEFGFHNELQYSFTHKLPDGSLMVRCFTDKDSEEGFNNAQLRAKEAFHSNDFWLCRIEVDYGIENRGDQSYIVSSKEQIWQYKAVAIAKRKKDRKGELEIAMLQEMLYTIAVNSYCKDNHEKAI